LMTVQLVGERPAVKKYQTVEHFFTPSASLK
jgi:hypothetical protein